MSNEEKKDKLTWEKPELKPLNGADAATGTCSRGSGDGADCSDGEAPGTTCGNGTADL